MKNNRGFALLIAVIFMSVMLAFGLALSSLGYKQKVLASSVTDSQYAFYAADAGLECALYADQKLDTFAIGAAAPPADQGPPAAVCEGLSPRRSAWVAPWSAEKIIVSNRFDLEGGTRCVDITMYKPSASNQSTYIFAQGYSASCATVENAGVSGARFVARGINVRY